MTLVAGDGYVILSGILNSCHSSNGGSSGQESNQRHRCLEGKFILSSDEHSMKISLFTPSHDTRFLPEVWESIRSQSHKDFEWNILLNNGASDYHNFDLRVHVDRDESIRNCFLGAALY